MKRNILYGALGLLILVFDRVSKMYALNHWQEQYSINPYLYFQVTMNRGISWGMLNYSHGAIFALVTFIIVSVTGALIWYTQHRLMQGKPVMRANFLL